MKSFRLFSSAILLAGAVVSASCSNIENTGLSELSISFDYVTPLSSTAGFSCKNLGSTTGDLAKQWFEIQNVVFNWKSENTTLYIDKVILRLAGAQIASGTVDIELSTDELSNAFTSWNPKMLPKATQATHTYCGLRGGNIKPQVTGTIPGHIIVTGFSKSDNGEFGRVQAQVPFAVKATVVDNE